MSFPVYPEARQLLSTASTAPELKWKLELEDLGRAVKVPDFLLCKPQRIMVPATNGLTLVSLSGNACYALSGKYHPLLTRLRLPHPAGMGIAVKGLVPC